MTTPTRSFWHRLVQAATAPKAAAVSAIAAPHAGLASPMRPLALEQRFMFDGAGAADATHAAADATTATSDAGQPTSTAVAAMMEAAAHDRAIALLPQAVEVRAAEPSRDNGRKEVVLIDTSLANYKTLEAGIRDGVGIVEFDGSADGLAQIAAWAASQSNYDAIHILSHGSEGVLNLGTLHLSASSLAAESIQQELAQLGQALTSDGDLLLYGCDVAAGSQSTVLLQGLAQATGADVAASSDATGAASLGGNWTLETHIGQIEAAALSVSDYQNVLGVATVPTTIVTVASFSADSGVAGDFITNVALQTISGTLSAPLAAGETVQVSLDNGVTWADATIGTGQSNWTLSSQTLSGSSTLQARVTNSDGSSSPYSHSYTLDTTAPATPTTPTLAAGSDSGGSSSDNITNVTTPTLTGTAESYSTVMLYGTDGTTVLGSATAVGGVWAITSRSLTQGVHSLSVTVTDAAGNVSARSTALQITIDTSAPGVNSVAVPADGIYQSGETLTFNVNFNEAVLVDTNGGTPRIALTIGSTTRYATYVSGSGSNTLVFSYVVVNGDSDNDGITVGALSTNGGSVRDVAGNDASTTINGMGSTTAVLVDGRAARVTNISASSDNGSYGAGSTITITVEFSSAVDVDITGGMPSLSLSSGGTTSYVDGSGTSTLTFSYTVGAGQNSADLDYSSANALQLNGASITESSNHRVVAITLAAPGSAGSLGANKNLVIDTVAPTAVGSSVFFSADTGNSGTDLITKTAVQTISGTLSGTLAINESVWVSLDNGSHWTQAIVTGSNWTLPDQILNSSNTLQVRVQDAAANYGPAFSAGYVLDVRAPTVSISSNTSTLKAGEAATITFTFSEQVTGFTLSDLIATGGTLSNFSTTADPLVYTAIFTPSAGFSGSASVTLGNNLYTDLVGNNGSGSSSPTLTVDTLIPTLSISSNHSSLKAGETGLITFTFSEAPIGFNMTDLVISGGTLSGFTATASPLVYTAVVTPAAGIHGGILSVTVAAGTFTDVAGNASQASSSVAISYDTATPATSAMSVVFSNDTGTSSTDLVTSITTQIISGMLSANLVAGETVEVSLNNGNTWSIASASSNAWSLATVLTSSGVLQVRVVDVAGNSGPVFSSAYVLDQSPPTIAITSNVATVNGMEPALITFTFSEVPVGFNASDIDVSGGTLNNFTPTSDPLVYTATFTADSGIANGSASITILAASYSDAAGNAGTSASIPFLQIDTVGPAAMSGGVSFNQDSGVSGDFITNVAGQIISGNLSAPLASGDTVQISLDNGASWTIVPTSIGDTNWSISQTLSQGSNTLLVKVSDTSGNNGVVLSQAYTLDTTPPTAPTVTAQTTQSLAPVLSGNATLATGESLIVSVGGATYNVIPTAGVWTLDLATTTPTSGTLTLTLNQEYSVVATVTDIAGNHSSGSAKLITGTTTNPENVPLGGNALPPAAVVPPEPAHSIVPDYAYLGLLDGAPPLGGAAPFLGGRDFGTSAFSTASEVREGWMQSLLEGSTFNRGIFSPFPPANLDLQTGLQGMRLLPPVVEIMVGSDSTIVWQLPPSTLVGMDGQSTVKLSMTQADDQPLPAWIKFDARTGELSGTMPPGFEGALTLRLTARDSQGNTVVKTIHLKASDVAPQGRAGMAEQLQRHAQLRAGQVMAQRLHL